MKKGPSLRWNRPKHGKTVEKAEAWENDGIGRNVGKRWSHVRNVALVGGQMAETGKNGLNVKNRWNGKTRLSVTVESAENVGKRWPHGQKRGKTVVEWPKWSKTVAGRPKRGKTVAGRPKRGKTVAGRPKRRENGGTSTETGERDQDARFTALLWETAKRRENGGRTDGGCENRGQAAETEENRGTTDGNGQKLINVPRTDKNGRYGGDRAESSGNVAKGPVTVKTVADRPKRRKTVAPRRKQTQTDQCGPTPGSRPLLWESGKNVGKRGRTDANGSTCPGRPDHGRYAGKLRNVGKTVDARSERAKNVAKRTKRRKTETRRTKTDGKRIYVPRRTVHGRYGGNRPETSGKRGQTGGNV